MSRSSFSGALGRQIRIGGSGEDLGASSLTAALEELDKGNVEEAKSLLASYRHEQQVVHDLLVDWLWAMLTWVRDDQGEAAVEAVLRSTLAPWAESRYAGYLDLTFDEQLFLALEGMRGHLSGPGRLGSVAVRDEGDHVVLEFDPCGSGGRARRGDRERGIPPSSERPELGDSSGAHDWTWQQDGVCLYCAHCSLVNEILPIERFGFPIRVTEYPTNPSDSCRWLMYKDPMDIPEEAYLRVGKVKPSAEELAERMKG